MDIFTRFNQRKIQDRQIDTLIGLSKGILADGKVDQAEAEFLQTWLVQNQHSANPVILNLLSHVSEMLSDGFLDAEESLELLSILRNLSGESVELGEIAKTSNLPLCSPVPKIEFSENVFLFTGTFAFGTRKQCHEVVTSKGGNISKNVTKKINYLVLGTYVTDSWAHENYGRKIEKAMDYRNSGVPISIVNEECWLEAAEF